jgi:hypothetical protein
MKTVSDLLRDADPIGAEPQWSAEARSATRQAVLDRSASVERTSSRPITVASVFALAVIALAIGMSQWSRTSVAVLAAVRFEVRLAEETPGLGLREVTVSNSGRRLYLHPEVIVTNSDILQAEVVQGSSASTFNIATTFSAAGGAKMLQATRNHLGRPVAILLDGEVVMAPVVRAPINTAGVISGDFTRAEADRIAAGILTR